MRRKKSLVLLLSAVTMLLSLSPARAGSGPSRSSSIQTLYIVPSSHWDLGFTVPPEEQLDAVKPHLDEVIRTARSDPRFRWVIESAWQLGAWLDRNRDPGLEQDLVRLIRSGQIQLSAVYGSEHTEFMGSEELNRIAYPMREIERRLGVTTDLAMMDDVPGFTLRLPQVLHRSGIRYFVTGSNLFLGGGTSLHPGHMPFRWRSPDGSTVLTWQTGSRNGGYVEAMADYYLDSGTRCEGGSIGSDPTPFYPAEWKGLAPLEIMQRGVDKLEREYTQAGYRYDAAMVIYAHDFIPASCEEKGLLPAVRAWNAAGRRPRLVVATPAEFFAHMEKRYPDAFPTYSGDFSGLWSEVKTNSPGISADARWVQDHLPQAEALWTLSTFRRGTAFPREQIEDAATRMLRYDEHSGAGQTGWPKLMTRDEVDRQNREYSAYATTARSETERLLGTGMERLFSAQPDPARAPKCIVYNPLSWNRTELVRVRPPAPGLTEIRDASSGRVIATQREPDGELSFLAEAIPPIGYRTYIFARPRSQPARSVSVASHVAENGFYRLALRDGDGTIASLVDKQTGRELINPLAARHFGEMVRWTLRQYLERSSLESPTWQAGIEHLHGPLADELRISRPGSWWPGTRIVLDNASKRVTIENVFDRSKMPEVPMAAGSEFYGFEFPFRLDAAAGILVDDGIGFHRFPADDLPGAREDAVTPIHNLSLVDEGQMPGASVSLLAREDFFEIPVHAAGKGGAFQNEVLVQALRKADQGETRDQGVQSFATVEPGYGPLYHSSFAITSDRRFDPIEAWRAGWNFDVPLLVASLPAGRRPRVPMMSFLALSNPNVVVLALKPSADGNPDHLMLRLQEIAGRDSVIALRPAIRISQVAETSMTEDRTLHPGLNKEQLRIGGHQTLTLLLTVPHHDNDWQAK